MNNHALLRGFVVATLLSSGLCAVSQNRQTFTIEHLFELAENNSAQIKPFITAEKEAQQNITVAKNNRLPDINADLSLSYIGNGFTTKRNFTDLQSAPIPHLGSGLTLNITQPVYAGGAITTGIELARLKSTASRFATELQRDNIRLQLTGLYLDIYKCSNLRTVVESNIAQAKKVLADMQARFQQGTALRNDITRYELLISNLELQLIKINNTVSILNDNLTTITGLDKETEIEPDSTILQRSLPLADMNWWQKEASDNAPSIKLAETTVDINRKAEKISKSERLPKIGLQAGWNIDGPILVEVPPINRNLSYWYVGVGLSYNLASLYKTNKSIAKSKTATHKAIQQLDAEREKVNLSINSDYIHYREAYQELLTRRKSVELALQNYHTTSTRFSEGMALITDMLDAANSKLDAEQQLVNAQINIIFYYYKLLFTSGKI